MRLDVSEAASGWLVAMLMYRLWGHGIRRLEVCQDAFLDNMLQARERPHDDVPMLPHYIHSVIDIAAQRGGE